MRPAVTDTNTRRHNWRILAVVVARWYIEQCGGAEVTRKLITLGTP
jgi:hypothetical protein